jgi:hypothetical protein
LTIGEISLRAAPDLTEGTERIALIVDPPQTSKKQRERIHSTDASSSRSLDDPLLRGVVHRDDHDSREPFVVLVIAAACEVVIVSSQLLQIARESHGATIVLQEEAV